MPSERRAGGAQVLTQPTLEKLNAMKLTGMAQALSGQLGSGEYARLSFEERFGLHVDAEWTAHEERTLCRRLPKVRHPASLEDVDFKHPRHLDRQQVLSLGSCSWIQNRHNLVIIGPTRIGKS
jgi:DNA replication protein DnaC